MFNRIDTAKINPNFLSLCKQLVENCKARGVLFYAISGFRSEQEQAKLYAQGRTTPGKIVTNAKPYQSLHNFGLAIDFCADKDATKEGLQPDWNMAQYKILQEEAHKLGLTSGLDFKSFPEGPHIQLKISKPLPELEKVFKTKGLEAVWTFVN